MNLHLTASLQDLRQRNLYRQRTTVDSPQGANIRIAGQQLVNFCSNDYLGLANHPRIVAALRAGAEKYGVGSGASHLVSGHQSAHQELEEELADATGRARALLFSTGYMANLGILTALASRRDTVLQDRLNHASLIDGARLAGARLRRYPHADAGCVRQWLSNLHEGQRLIASDAVFSMDGDLAPLNELAATARDCQATLIVDDAHGFGVLGKTGGGTLQHLGLTADQVPVLMATLGKAVGTFGAFVAGSSELIEALIQFARPYIYTTALPPALAHAARISLRIVHKDSWRRSHLNDLILFFRQGAQQLGLDLLPSDTPIQPLVIGSEEKTLAASKGLRQQGMLVAAIRPPTVPRGTARLRITLSASHTHQQVERLLDALDCVCGTGAGTVCLANH